MKNKYRARNRMPGGRPTVRWVAKSMLVKATDWMVSPVRSEVSACFVVGCGHSGTTLVASKLGQHPEVKTIARETQAFYPNTSLLFAKGMVSEWTFDAVAAGKTLVVEKTPKHVHCIQRIRQLVPGARFILLSRTPLDAVASLFLRFNVFDVALERWIMDNRAMLRWLDCKDALHVRFEDIVLHPEKGFKRITHFLGLPWSSAVLASGDSVYDNPLAVDTMDQRRTQVKKDIYVPVSKWRQVLSETQIREIKNQSAGVAEQLGYGAPDTWGTDTWETDT